MRKLLIKLVAIETALVGWLSYWLFLVYANNPSVADQLSSSLQRFPQLSFSTIDIAVLVIIGALAVTLAFKFQRGLRPGIRLERALQMLENLMKRNLILESQVAELKIEKSHLGPSAPLSTITSPPLADQSRSGSWEKAFRTPLEAGAPASPKTSGVNSEEIPFGNQTGVPPPRIEPKLPPAQSTAQRPTIILTEKGQERTSPPPTIITGTPEKPPFVSPSTSSSWEDSPKFIGETRGILTPSPPPRKIPAVSESGGLKQPYIPAPVPRPPSPTIIAGPRPSSISTKNPLPSTTLKTPSKQSLRSIASPKTATFAGPDTAVQAPRLDSTPVGTSTLPPVDGQSGHGQMNDILPKTETAENKPLDDSSRAVERTRVKDAQPTKKRPAADGA